MLKLRNICLSVKNSTLQTTLPANDKAVVKNLFSWYTVSKVYQFLSWRLLGEVTEEEAKGYTKVLLLLFSAVAIGGLMEGLDSLIDSQKYNHDEYPGNEIDELFDEVGNIMCKLGDVIGRDIALQAFNLCKNKEGGEA